MKSTHRRKKIVERVIRCKSHLLVFTSGIFPPTAKVLNMFLQNFSRRRSKIFFTAHKRGYNRKCSRTWNFIMRERPLNQWLNINIDRHVLLSYDINDTRMPTSLVVSPPLRRYTSTLDTTHFQGQNGNTASREDGLSLGKLVLERCFVLTRCRCLEFFLQERNPLFHSSHLQGTKTHHERRVHSFRT